MRFNHKQLNCDQANVLKDSFRLKLYKQDKNTILNAKKVIERGVLPEGLSDIKTDKKGK